MGDGGTWRFKELEGDEVERGAFFGEVGSSGVGEFVFYCSEGEYLLYISQFEGRHSGLIGAG